MDVVFIGNTAYVLVTLVATDLNGVFGPGTVPEPGNVVGIYQIDGCDRTRFRRAADGRRPVRAWPQAVLAGTVLSIEPLPNPSCEQVMAHQRIRFQVQKAWRGGVSGVVEIRTGAGGGDCG